jgi:hypothetical protein
MKKKIGIFALIILASWTFQACSNMHLSGGVGMSFTGGPYGPTIRPTMNIGVYGGGPVRW